MSDNLIYCELCEEWTKQDPETGLLLCGHTDTGEELLDDEYDGGYRPLNFNED